MTVKAGRVRRGRRLKRIRSGNEVIDPALARCGRRSHVRRMTDGAVVVVLTSLEGMRKSHQGNLLELEAPGCCRLAS